MKRLTDREWHLRIIKPLGASVFIGLMYLFPIAAFCVGFVLLPILLIWVFFSYMEWLFMGDSFTMDLTEWESYLASMLNVVFVLLWIGISTGLLISPDSFINQFLFQ